MIVVHVTHEAVEKIGGIGTVIDGLTTAEAYGDAVSRTILVGPLFTKEGTSRDRLGPNSTLLFSSLDDIRPPEWSRIFTPIEKAYDVGIAYGTRTIREPYSGRDVEVEVVVFDLFHANRQRVSLFKGQLYEKFGISSDRYESIWDYEQYVRLACPAMDAIHALCATNPASAAADEKAADEPIVLLSHEYMGMPTALKAILDGEDNIKTVFYAHEVASVRPIVENEPGHDTMFYNVMEQAHAAGQTLEEVFPQVHENYKHPLVKASRYCDRIFAVGDYVAKELAFLDTHFSRVETDLVYNGIPAEPCTLAEKKQSREMLGAYLESVLGYRPTWIFTHVARPVLSKGIWRDVRILHEMEPLLKARGETAAFIMLGTLGGTRRGSDVRQMESIYSWPLVHEEGYPDLCGGEEVVYREFDVLNRTHEQGRALLVNQWGFNRKACGRRMPEGMTINDLRRGSDLEFGLSVYEPFGISQLEPLCYGALCVPSNVCGCMGYVNSATAEIGPCDNVIEGDYITPAAGRDVQALLNLSIGDRDAIESQEGRRLAEIIMDRLPRDEATLAKRMDEGLALAKRMGWEYVVRERFLPSLGHAAEM